MDRQLPAVLACLFRHLLLLASCLCMAPSAAHAAAPVTLLTIDGAIGPASADYVVRGLATAAAAGNQLVILQIDTPGGLDTSMRTVIKAILASPVPVAAYVAPGGARAASAGTYIVYASHVAAMAPGTNMGAATPVQLGGSPGTGPPRDSSPPDSAAPRATPAPKPSAPPPSETKAINDAEAYLQSLAKLRGRNAAWGAMAVREARSLTADEALRIGVVDLVAADVPSLMRQLDGRQLRAGGRDVTLATGTVTPASVLPDWRARLLGVISAPTVALMLLTIGVYGLLFEFMSPGTVAPGVIGALCLLLGLYGLQLLPVNYAGLGLLLLGMAFMVAEAFLPSFGALGLGGIAAFVGGALVLIDTDVPGYGIPLGLIVGLALTSALLLAGTAALALRARRAPLRTGPGQLVGSVGDVLDAAGAEGWANVQGETWRVVSSAPLQRAQKVRVLARRGELLEVAALPPGWVAPRAGPGGSRAKP